MMPDININYPLNFVFTPRNYAEETFDLYFRPGVSGTTYWAWIEVLPAGQTISLPVSLFASPQGFFTGGSRADTDQDGLTDGFELLVSKTNPTNQDSAVDLNSDADGDNLPYAAEWKLRTNPNVADNPLTLNNLSDNQQISGTGYVNLNISSLVPSSTTFSLVVDGVVSPDASVEKNGNQWRLVWDTNSTLNGAYTIQLQMQYPGEYGTFGLVRGPGKSVTVNNALTFDPLTKHIGDTLTINAWVNHFNSSDPVDIVVDFYDENNNHVGYDVMRPQQLLDEHGHGTGLWFIAGQYSPEDDANLPADQNIRAAFFEVAKLTQAKKDSGQRPSTQGAPAQQRTYTKEVSWTGDDFVVAWSWDTEAWKWGGMWRQDFSHKHRMIQNGVINIIANPALDNEYRVFPSPNAYGSSSTFSLLNSNDKTTLLNALAAPNSRNFLWFGHGSDWALSNGKGDDDFQGITHDEVEEALHNHKYGTEDGTPVRPNEGINQHPYRLVILIGCETDGVNWCNAFGITQKSSTVAEYQALQRKPRAIVLWETDVTAPEGAHLFNMTGRQALQHSKMAGALGVLFANWMANRPLNVCMDAFARKALEGNIFGIDKFRGMENYKIYGCQDLTRNGP